MLNILLKYKENMIWYGDVNYLIWLRNDTNEEAGCFLWNCINWYGTREWVCERLCVRERKTGERESAPYLSIAPCAEGGCILMQEMFSLSLVSTWSQSSLSMGRQSQAAGLPNRSCLCKGMQNWHVVLWGFSLRAAKAEWCGRRKAEAALTASCQRYS